MKFEIRPCDAFQKLNDGRVYTVEMANEQVVSCYECRLVKAKFDRYTRYLERSGCTEVWCLSDFLRRFKPVGRAK